MRQYTVQHRQYPVQNMTVTPTPTVDIGPVNLFGIGIDRDKI